MLAKGGSAARSWLGGAARLAGAALVGLERGRLMPLIAESGIGEGGWYCLGGAADPCWRLVSVETRDVAAPC